MMPLDLDSAQLSSIIAAPSSVKSAGAVTTIDAESFSRLLAEKREHLTWPSTDMLNVPASSSQGVVESLDPASAGAGLVGRLQQIEGQVRANWDGVVSLLGDAARPPSVSDLLNAQIKLANVEVLTDIGAIGMKKVSNAIEQLLRMQ